MSKRIIDNIQKKWFPYVCIFGVILFLEIFVFNISTWKTLGCEPIILAENMVTNDEGKFVTETVQVNDYVKNVNVVLTTERYDRAEVVVTLTDEGDYYAYDLATYTVVPGVENSGYQNIYPYGKVGEMRITISVPEGTLAQVRSVSINEVRPFEIKPLRMLVLLSVVLIGYLFFAENARMLKPCQKDNKGQLIIIICCMFFIFVLAGALVRSNPAFVHPKMPHHKQYQELARAMEHGTVIVDDKPNPALLEKENPYDTIALAVEGISFRMDYAFFNDVYYVYFGIIPELLFFLPYYLLTGQDFPNYLAVFALYCALVVGIFGCIRELIFRYASRVPFAAYLLLACSTSLMPNYVFMLGRPDLYNIPIMGANAFVFVGIFFWLLAMNSEKRKWLWYGLGALSLACVAGCRPQFLLYVIALFMVLLMPKVWEQRKEWKKNGKIVVAVILPVVIIAAVVFWYNMARFGSGFDFGATYSLTSNDMNHRGFNFSRVVRGLYSFLLQPPVINATFPFLESSQLRSDYMGKNLIEFCYGGLFVNFPLLISLWYFLLGGLRKSKAQVKQLVTSLCAVSFVIAVFDINSAGILQRYMGDMVFGFLLAAVLVWILLLSENYGKSSYRWLIKGNYLCVVAGLIFSFMVVITSANGASLETYNPTLFYEIASYFKL